MSNDAGLIASAARLVAAARGAVEDYAGLGAPSSADQVRALLAATGCHVEIFTFRSDAVGMTLPLCHGVHPVLVNGSLRSMDRLMALRHQVAHVLAGDAGGSVCLVDGDCDRPAERLADLFALADAVPGWWIARTLRRFGGSWRALEDETRRCVAELATLWPAARVRDRAELRLRLFREAGI
jgi:hypothetical protein